MSSTLDPASLPAAPTAGVAAPSVRPMPELAGHLATRRSSKPFHLVEPGPSRPQLEAILRLAARVPDHGKLAPWRLVVIQGEARAVAGERLASIAAALSEVSEATIDAARNQFLRTPLTIMVVCAAAPHPKIPEWEQILSCGALCHNLLLAAEAFGFGAVWLTGWAAYDAAAQAALGLSTHERVAGFVHVGTQAQTAEERDRPDLARIATWL